MIVAFTNLSYLLLATNYSIGSHFYRWKHGLFLRFCLGKIEQFYHLVEVLCFNQHLNLNARSLSHRDYLSHALRLPIYLAK